MNNWNRGGRLSWVITGFGLALAGFLGLSVWNLLQSSQAVGGFEFTTVAVIAAGCVAILVFANTSYLIYLLERQKADLIVVNGYSLKVMGSIISRIGSWAIFQNHIEIIREDVRGAAAKRFDTGFAAEEGAEGKPPLRFPESVREELEHVFKWMNSPTRDRFFNDYNQLLAFLDAAKLRLDLYRSA